MNIHQLFPSKWLSPADLGSRSFELTIKTVTLEKVRNPQTNQEEVKPAVAFEKAQKIMLLNKTQCFAIAEITGHEDTITITINRPANKGPVAPQTETFTIPESDNPFGDDE